jgi:uncharacterized membrane protein YdbT with pleckstrin-like domain
MARFPRELLADHEEIRFELRPHWIALAKPAFWTLAALAILIIGSRLAPDTDRSQQIVALVSFTLWIALAVIPFLNWLYTLFVLTTDRLITRSGVFAKRSKEIPLERINDVAFTQSIFERIVGAGSLMIESAGESGQNRITDVRHPEKVQLTIYKEAEENSNRMMRGGAAAPSSTSIPEQIEALARLRDQGVLSEEEFSEKKQDLLKRI